jgi:hypothetical protein
MPNGINEALFAAQKAMPQIQKDKINPHFGNRYVGLESVLEAVLPVLQEQDILMTQALSTLAPNGVPGITTRFVHVPTGEFFEDSTPLILDKQTPQALGSAITYTRRYTLLSALGLVADEDDDAESATSTPTRQPNTISGAKKAVF